MKHQALIGKQLTSRAAAYPEQLAKEYAMLVVMTFKTTLQMEWWRHQLKVKSEEVSIAQKNWLASKQKKQMPPTTVQDLTSSKRAWLAEEVEKDDMPTERPSKRRRREVENDHFVRGMRNPAKAVSRLHKVCQAGKDVRRLWTRFVADHPQVLEAAGSYGSENETLEAWTRTLEKFLKVKEFDDVVLRPPGRFSSPPNAKLWEAWRKYSGDPERHLVSWIRSGTALGHGS